MGQILRGGQLKEQTYHLDAFLAYWPNYFVFPNPSEDGTHAFVFPMEVSHAQGKRLALASWYLGSLYAHLEECLRNITRSFGRYDVVSFVDTNFLQLFLWERFRVLFPKP